MKKPLSSNITNRLGISALFFLLSLNHLHPLLKSFFTKLPYATMGDVRLTLCILYSDIHKLAHLQFGQIYHLPILFPLSHTMTIGFTMLGQALLLLPFSLFGEPNIYPLYNGLIIFSYLAAGWGAYLFFKELQEDETAAIVAACLYLLLPFRVNSIPHLNLLLNFPIPFSLFFLLRFLKSNRTRDLLFLNAFLMCQFLFDLSHSFFLTISLALLVLIFVSIRRPIPWCSLLALLLSLLPTMAFVIFIHLPFLKKGVALSIYGPSFNPEQYSPAISFYINKSSLLLLLKKLRNPWPFFPGFLVVFFNFYSFSHYAKELWEKALLWGMTAAYAIPGLIAVIFCRRQDFAWINSLAEIGLVTFFVSLAVLIYALRKKLPLELKLVSLFLLAITFITFQPFPRIFDLFNALTRFFPFLQRSRGLRTSYIVPMAILGIFTFGFKAFYAKYRGRKFLLGTLVLLLLVEHLRWPVSMAKLPEPGKAAKKIYSLTNTYPSHYGLLELPFGPTSGNMYSLFSIYHNKHTYHGHYLIYDDPLGLEKEATLQVDREFSGLNDPALLGRLRDNGLYLIMISDSFIRCVYDGDVSAAWHKTRNSARAGLKAGLYREIKEERHAMLIVLDDSRTGRDIIYPIPYFALTGKTAIRFKIRTQLRTRCRIQCNGYLLAAGEYSAGDHMISLALHSAPLQSQVNHVRIISDQPITACDWRIE